MRGPQRVGSLSELPPRVKRIGLATRNDDCSRGAIREIQHVLVQVILVLADVTEV